MSERICRDASHRLFFRNQFFADHVDSDAHGSMAGPFAVPCLQNIETIFFHGELEVLHVFEVMFKDGADFHQIFVRCWHLRCQIGDRMRRAYARDDVFALRVNQIFAIEDFFAGGWIARECNSSSACFAHVAKDHRLHVDCRAPIVWDPVLPPINDRAIVYRRKYGIPHDWGTAVNVQTMVFGNMGKTSATGVAFTRDPATGEKVFYGEYLIDAQGEDVVAGVRTPHRIADLAKEMPTAHKDLTKVRAILERHFKDMQDLEFTVEENRLYILQTRNGKRTGHAAVRIAVDMVDEKLITKKEAVRRIPADSLAHLLAPIFDRQSAREAKKVGSGLAAGPGAASGHVVFSAEEAVARAEKVEKVVLARIETSPEDLRGMIAAEGILTSRGGVSSHAALVARQMGKVCVCGATAVQIDYQKRTLSANGTTLKQGDYISVDGTAGEVFAGEVTTAPSEIVQVLVDGSLDPKRSVTYQEYAKLMRWPDRCDAGNDPCQQQGRSCPSAGETASLSTRRFHRHLYGVKRLACNDPLSRSAASRIPATRSRPTKRTREQTWRAGGAHFPSGARAA